MKFTKPWQEQTPWQKLQNRFGRSNSTGTVFYKKILIAAGLTLAGLFTYGTFFLPPVDNADQLQFAQSTIIYDRQALDPKENPNDHILYVIHGDENREYVPLAEISPWIKKATVAIEDDGFYNHFGFDIGGITKAILNRFFNIGVSRGGSTITQQLVKNSFLSREKTILRKFKEILLAVKVEWYYTKDEILELYLNKIPYGHNAHGIEAASKTFFGKSARDLTLAESSILASLPVAPTRFSPYGAKKDLLTGFYHYSEDKKEKTYKKGRKDLVLQRMLDLKMITFDEFKTAWTLANNLEFKIYRTDIRAPHFVFYIREKLEEKYGKEFLRQGGLRIYTTLDPELQTLAETVITEKTSFYEEVHEAKNAALTAINSNNGEILAFVGGKDYFDTENDGQVNILTSRRQPGSSFKPIVYASAFEKGYSPATVLFDVETDFGGNYTPQNFDGKFLGPVAARDALNRSLNIPAIKMAYLATPQGVLDTAETLGIKFEGDGNQHGVAIGIGVAEVEPLSHISAYQVFTGDGSYHEPTSILKIEDSGGSILETFNPEETKKEGLSPEAAALVRHILTDETTRPTTDDFDWNRLLQLKNLDNGSKTGTSNRTIENPDFDEEEEEDEDDNPKEITAPGDSWTIGFTPHLVTGVWVGNNRGEPMKPGATGLAVAAPIWKKFTTDAHTILEEREITLAAAREGLEELNKGISTADPESDFKTKPYPEVTLETREINKFSGLLATKTTPPELIKEEVFAPFAVPTREDDSLKKSDINRRTGRKANTFTPYYLRTKKQILSLNTIRPDMPNWSEPVKEWLEKHPRFLASFGVSMDPDPDEDEDRDSSENVLFRTTHLDFFSRQTQRQKKSNPFPKEYFSQPQAPIIKILSPKQDGTLATGEAEATVSIKSKSKIRSVEYYLDDVLVAESSKYPWKGSFRIPKDTKQGSKHFLRAVAIDEFFTTNEDHLDFKIARDTKGPEITILGPRANSRIPINSTFTALAQITDLSSKVSKTECLLDKESLGQLEGLPFEKTITATKKLGRHFLTIRAWDAHNNMSEKSIPITFEREKLIQQTSPEITKIINQRSTIAIDIIFPEPEKVESATLVLRKGEELIQRKKFKPTGKSAQITIPKTTKGGIQIWLETKLKNKRIIEKSATKTVKF